MQAFRELTPYEMDQNMFRMIGNDWMLVGAKSGGRTSMMTASWGGAGILWHKPVVFVFIRPQRFTKTLVDAADGFSCTFYDPAQYREQLTLCGSKSGRDIDKVAACGFDVLEEDGVPYFAQAHTAILCRKLYRQPLDPEAFIVPGLDAEFYPKKDFHDVYVGEIKKVLVRG